MSEAPWTRQIRLLLDQAIQSVNALRIRDYEDHGVRAATTFLALNAMLFGPEILMKLLPSSCVAHAGSAELARLSVWL